uniref:Uncharacterized protein n=1 Tax=Heterorhabditis bacteriophora TaxID=37862 RepID=A0A1I7W891_HETBA
MRALRSFSNLIVGKNFFLLMCRNERFYLFFVHAGKISYIKLMLNRCFDERTLKEQLADDDRDTLISVTYT